MGFLDKKERVLDVVLTDKGRELLSQNLLDFTFFAFSDEGVDYGAALTASLQESGSVDDHIRQTLTFEANQHKNFKEQTDLKTFLYSIPERRRTLPDFVTNFDDRPDIDAVRRFFIDTFSISARVRNVIKNPAGAVLRTTLDKKTAQKKFEEYVRQQKIVETQQRLEERKNVVGLPIGPGAIMIAANKVLEVASGRVFTLDRYLKNQKKKKDNVRVLSVSKDIEIVTGLDRVKINLDLKSSEGRVPIESGYLVEVFESGSDGSITKLFEENVVDVLEDTVLQRGFGKDLFVDTDVTRVELIRESRRLRRRELRKRKLVERRARRQLQRKINRTRYTAGAVPPPPITPPLVTGQDDDDNGGF